MKTRLSRFSEFRDLNSAAMQSIIYELDTSVLVCALVKAPRNIQSNFLTNMSSRKAEHIWDEVGIAYRFIPLKESKKNRLEVIGLANKLADEGVITLKVSRVLEPYTFRRRKPKTTKAVSAIHKSLMDITSFPDNNSKYVDYFEKLTKLARAKGLLSLEGIAEQCPDPMIREGLQYLVDGWEPESVKKILTRRKEAILAQEEQLMNIIIEGIMALSSGDNPRVVRALCASFLAEGGRE